MKHVLFFNEITPEFKNLVGSKTYNLAFMFNAGLNVPNGFGIVSSAKPCPEVYNEIMDAFKKLNCKEVAVRSSSILEDTAGRSAAGQYESVVHVTENTLIDAYNVCYNSASNPVVRSYFEGKDLPPIGITVQKMINAEIFGVTFTANPLNNNRNEVMIDVTVGDGELLVGGIVTPSNFIFNKTNYNIISSVIMPELYEKFADIETVLKQALPVFEKVEKLFGCPVDIEWAIQDNNLYILQARPITTV